MDENYETDDLLQEAIDRGYIDEKSKEAGIAQFCNDKGYNALSDAQKAVYKLRVLPHLKKLQEKRDLAERAWGMPD